MIYFPTLMNKIDTEATKNIEPKKKRTFVRRIISYRNLVYILGFIMKMFPFVFTALAYYLQKCDYENNLSRYKQEYKELGFDENIVYKAVENYTSKFLNAIQKLIFELVNVIAYPYVLDYLSTIPGYFGYSYDYFITYSIIFYNLSNLFTCILYLGFISMSSFIILVYLLHVKLYKNKKYAQFVLSLIFAAHLSINLSFFFTISQNLEVTNDKLNEYSSIASENNEITNLLIKYNVRPENVFIKYSELTEGPAESVSDIFQGKIAFNKNFITRLTHKQICSILAHELGHIESKHCLKDSMLDTFSYLSCGVLSFYSLSFAEKYVSTPKAIVFALFQKRLFYFLHQKIFNLFVSHKYEYEADSFSVKEGYGKESLEVLLDYVKIDKEIYDRKFPLNMFFSHPSIKKRCERIKEALK